MPKPSPRSNDTVTNGAPPAGGATGLEIGLSLVVAVLGLGGLGLLVDRFAGWGPWLMLLGGFAGFGIWLASVARRKRR